MLWIKDLSNPKTLKADILAGLTVGFVIVPQSMAYAQLAGLGPQYGLYAAFLPVLVAAVMGSSRQLSTGPVAVVSLLTAAALGEIVTDPSSYAVYAALLALIVGLFQFLLGVLRLGFVVNFLSHPVVTGFTSAAAIIIGASQLPKVFGIRVISSNDSDWVSACQTLSIPERIESGDVGGLHTICNADQSYETIARLLEAAFYFTHLPTLAMALMGMVGILILQRFFPRMPAILTVAVLSTAASFLIDYQGMGGTIVNSININGLFSFKIPRFDFNVMGTLFVYAITISLIGFMEAISVAKSMAASTKQRLDVNQELIGQGLSNVTSSFFQGYPVSGSFSRSAVNLTAGAVTGFSSVVTAAIVGITILWLTPLLYHLPLATLAAIILMSVASLIHFAPLKHAWKVEKHDGLVGLLTFVMTLVFAPNLENGIAFGVIMSLGLFLYRTMEPNFSELSVEHGSIIASRFADDSNEASNVVKVAKWSGSLYFANAAYFETKLLELIAKNNEKLKYIIVDVASIVQVDASGEQVLSGLVETCSNSGVEILFARTERLEAELFRSGFKKRFGDNRFFDLRADALKYVWQELENSKNEDNQPQVEGLNDAVVSS
ncbi:MAG: sulfate permease [Gammaproteobacteria bacterium]|nr:sulfate permease [Gammaproteobacteria bacterium]MBT4974743.1 sulfate permease [Gammaproteobacteria bacterium]MBT8008948.1 sulfate permease [Gammaproteobacteria bacterium]